MSTADSGTPSIQLFGPQGLAHFVASTRLYSLRYTIPNPIQVIDSLIQSHLLRDSILVTPVECPPILPQEAIATPIFKDNNLTVIPVPIVPSSSSDTHDHTPPPIFRPFWNLASSPLPSHSLAPQNSSSLTGLAAEKWRYRVARSVFSGMQPTLAAPRGQNISTKKLPTMHTVPSAISYIGIGPSIRGKFDPVKAKALGVKPGPDFGKLTKGENVLSKTGSVVSPETCMEPPLPPVVRRFLPLCIRMRRTNGELDRPSYLSTVPIHHIFLL
jgi:ribonuclease Z